MDYTTRAKLEKAEDGEFADQDVLNRNFDTIDKLIGAGGPYSSTSRPASPFVGQKIWETDSKQERTWNGSTWIWSGGARPIAGALAGNTTGNLSTVANAATGIVLSSQVSEGGISIVSNGGFNYLKFGEDGIYRVTMSMLGSQPTANANAAVVGCFGVYNSVFAYQGYQQLVTCGLSDTTNWKTEQATASIFYRFSAGYSICMLAYRSGGDTGTAVASSGNSTYLSVEYVSP